eukprot:scaffold70110_cov31-Tisochrysis_lutea.AAC.2
MVVGHVQERRAGACPLRLCYGVTNARIFGESCGELSHGALHSGLPLLEHPTVHARRAHRLRGQHAAVRRLFLLLSHIGRTNPAGNVLPLLLGK